MSFLDEIEIASPCPTTWESMRGDDRVRACDLCRKNVYNLSGMTRAEAERLVGGATTSICVRFFRRADGTVLTSDCPVGLGARARRQLKIAAAAFATFLGLGLTASVSAGERSGTSVIRKLFSRFFPEPPPPVPLVGAMPPPRWTPPPKARPNPRLREPQTEERKGS